MKHHFLIVGICALSTSLFAQTAPVSPSLTGVKTIDPGGSGPDNYSSFTLAINDLNTSGVGSGGVTFNVRDGSVFAEDCPIITATGNSSDQVIFQRDNSTGVKPLIKPTGRAGSADAGISISGGDYITFDGIDITENTGSAVESGYYLRNASATDGARNNTIKNCKIVLNRSNSSSRGIYQVAVSTPTSSSGTNSYNKYYNITIENVRTGIWLRGASAYYDTGCEIGVTAGNTTTIGAATADDIGGSSHCYGIYTTYQKDHSIFNTEVRNVSCTGVGSGYAYGINIESSQGASAVYSNKVHDIKNSSGDPYYVYGFSATASSNSGDTLRVYNNIFYSFDNTYSVVTASLLLRIIYLSSGNINCCYNSARLDENDKPSNCLLYNNSPTAIIRNNILANYSTSGITSKRYCFYSNTLPASCSNNLYYINTGGTNNLTGYSGGDRTTLQRFAAGNSDVSPVDGSDGGSVLADPNFNGTTDLTFAGSTPARSSGTPVSGITTDFSGTSRDPNRPCIGAIETTQSQNDLSAPVLSAVNISNGTAPAVDVLLKDNSNSSANATIRLWYRQTGSSGAFTGLDADTKPSGTMNGTYSWSSSLNGLTAGTYQFYIAARDGQGAGNGIWVNPMWSVSHNGWNAADPPNFITNPDASAYTRTLQKLATLTAGTYNVGTAQPKYKKLTDVANQLNNSMLTGDVVFELNSDYDGTSGETFPVTFNQISTDGGTYSVTIRVKAGAGTRTTSGSNATNLVKLDGIDNLILDGREGGTGSSIAWTFSNTGTGATVSLTNDACSNTLRYLDLTGCGTTLTTSVVEFGLTTGTSGNDNNTVNHCNIHAGATTPRCGVHSEGTLSKANSGNTVSYCNIYNFFNSSADCAGIYLYSNNTDWTISNNRLYQEAPRTFTSSATYYGIYINSATGNNFSVSGNTIGYGASDGSGTTAIAGLSNMVRPLCVSVGNSTASSIQGNTAGGISQTTAQNSTTSNLAAFIGIYVGNGMVNIGNISGNMIGSMSGTGSITISASSTTVNTYASIGIFTNSTDNTVISGNFIGSVSVITGGSGKYVGFTGLLVSPNGAINTISNNVIGGTSSNSVTVDSQYGRLTGLYSVAGLNTISGNTIRNLTHSGPNTGTGSDASVIGIYQYATSPGQSITGNSISYLSNSIATSDAVGVTGIYYYGPTTGTNIVSGNLIHTLTVGSSSAASFIYGMHIVRGVTSYQNNCISLGSTLSGSYDIAGINDANGTNSFYFNSVYLGGSNVAGSAATWAFKNASTGTRVYKNNVFCNSRSNGSGTGTHYAVRYGTTSGLTADYNVFYTDGAGGMLGYYNAANYSTIEAWRTATVKDANSYNANPNFTSPVSLKPVAGSYLTGITVTGITTDYEGTTRSTPPDAGAFEGSEAGRWLGGTSADWAVTSNWDNGILPTSSDNVVIFAWPANKPHVTSDPGSPALCNNLTISAGANLTIDAGKALTVTNTVTNNGTAADLLIQQGGSLIFDEGIADVTMNKDIAAWTDDAHGWHFLSSPVESQAISPGFVADPPETYDFYTWWETTNEWVNYKNTTVPPTWSTANVLPGTGTGGGVEFVPGKGYLVAYYTASTKQFTGSLHRQDVYLNNLQIHSGTNAGWHLLGNPFQSALTWGTADWMLTRIVTTAKIWKESTASYVDIAPGGIIPAMNGFMVQVSNGTGIINIPKAARVHNTTTAWYKSSGYPTLLLVANDPTGHTAQESIVNFIPEATAGFDPAFDSHFFAGYAPQFYSVAGDEHLSTNALPEAGGTVSIPLNFIKNGGVIFSIEAQTISGITGPILLNDLKTGASQDLTVNPVYNFTSEPNDSPARFLVTFCHVGIGEKKNENPFRIYACNNDLYISNDSGVPVKGDVFVYSLLGQQLLQAKLNGNALTKIRLNGSSGYYLVQVVTDKEAYSGKVFLR